MPNADCSPREFVSMLQSMPIAGYTGYPGGIVSVTSYVSGNTEFDKKTLCPQLYALVCQVAKGKPEQVFTTFDGFRRIPSGQGGYADFFTFLDIINKYQAEFRRQPWLKKYFAETDFLQAICDAGGIGLDCIGFAGTYMEVAGLQASYVGRRPLDYASIFKPVRGLGEIKPYSAVMLTNGKHIQMIDSIDSVSKNSIKVTLCQSSSGGPQTNVGVTLTAGGGDYLHVEEYRRARDSKSRMAEYEQNKKGNESYDDYLRRTMTDHNAPNGYMHGAIFQLSRDGIPANPVGGSVYVGVHPQGITIRA